MNIGQVINGYFVLGVNNCGYSTKDAGLSKWTFVRKNEVIYFMKEFLQPSYPVIGCPGTEDSKTKKKKECSEFEAFHLKVKNCIDKNILVGSNLVNTIDFFRSGSKYYKITEKIDVAPITISDISNLPIEKRILILKTLSKSLAILHQLGIVHSDLKPENILIKRIENGFFVAHLIDYDNCYFSTSAPIPDKIAGDTSYYSPEIENYILNTSHSNNKYLTQKSDIFSLGLIFCQYLTGKFPSNIGQGKSASYVVNNNNPIKLTPKDTIPIELINLVNTMLLKNYLERPSINDVLSILDKVPVKNIAQKGKIIINMGFKKELNGNY